MLQYNAEWHAHDSPGCVFVELVSDDLWYPPPLVAPVTLCPALHQSQLAMLLIGRNCNPLCSILAQLCNFCHVLLLRPDSSRNTYICLLALQASIKRQIVAMKAPKERRLHCAAPCRHTITLRSNV
jgi:hypothetical protein